MTLYFSKTERLTDEKWMATIAPADHVTVDGKNLSRPRISETIFDDSEFIGIVIEKNSSKFPHVLTIKCIKGFPCVGRPVSVYSEEIGQ